jgi:hypothetical protein
MNQAFTQFQMCDQTIKTVLDARKGDKEASALRGLSEYLQAKILYEVGNAENADRSTRAVSILALAEADIDATSKEAWDSVFPPDIKNQFTSPMSVKAQINALRTLLETAGSQSYQGSTSN